MADPAPAPRLGARPPGNMQVGFRGLGARPQGSWGGGKGISEQGEATSP